MLEVGVFWLSQHLGSLYEIRGGIPLVQKNVIVVGVLPKMVQANYFRHLLHACDCVIFPKQMFIPFLGVKEWWLFRSSCSWYFNKDTHSDYFKTPLFSLCYGLGYGFTLLP
ncbi:hypothetical protein ACQJBY_048197 [Aegilops geniculata]